MSKSFAAFVVTAALAAGLAGCTTPTPYQPKLAARSSGGGFSDTRLEADRYRVTFQGNTMTSRETVEGYLLFRAAELTVQNGYDWFAVVVRDTDRQTRTYSQPDPFYNPWYGGYGFWRPSWRYYGRGYGWRGWDPFWGDPFWASRMDTRTVEQFEASAEILLHKGAKPEGDASAFDARAVIENLKPRIVYPTVK